MLVLSVLYHSVRKQLDIFCIILDHHFKHSTVASQTFSTFSIVSKRAKYEPLRVVIPNRLQNNHYSVRKLSLLNSMNKLLRSKAV